MDEKFKFMIGKEIDLLENYPKTKRNPLERAKEKTDSDREIARRFGKDFFDGERKHGYGGFNYNPKYWEPVIPTFKKYWNLKQGATLLDVGCGKGFMLYDLKKLIPGIQVKGIDISEYAIQNSKEEIKNDLSVADAKNLPFEDNSFDIVISINTIHNLEIDDCAKALMEIERVSKKFSYITVDAFRNEKEKELMYAWNLTAKTIMSVDDWKKFFIKNQYSGDFYLFIT